MNKEYTKVNDNDYIVTDEWGSINFVKFNGKVGIEEIFEKENEIDDLKEEKDDLEITKILLNDSFKKEKIMLILKDLFYLIVSILAVTNSLNIVLAICLFQLVSKNISFLVNISEINKQNNLIDKTIRKLDIEIPKLENELRTLMNEVEYERHRYAKIEGKVRPYSPVVDNYSDDYLNKDKNGCKRKILRKDFDV